MMNPIFYKDKKVWYDPKQDLVYVEYKNFVTTRIYTDIGGFKDSDGDRYYETHMVIKGDLAKTYGWISLGSI